MKRTPAKRHQTKSDVHHGLLDEYVDTDGLARELNRHPVTLIKWRRQGKGPPVTRVGKRVLYHLPRVRAWLRAQEQSMQSNC